MHEAKLIVIGRRVALVSFLASFALPSLQSSELHEPIYGFQVIAASFVLLVQALRDPTALDFSDLVGLAPCLANVPLFISLLYEWRRQRPFWLIIALSTAALLAVAAASLQSLSLQFLVGYYIWSGSTVAVAAASLILFVRNSEQIDSVAKPPATSIYSRD